MNDLVGLSKIVCTQHDVDTMLKDPQTPRYAQRRTHRTYTPQCGWLRVGCTRVSSSGHLRAARTWRWNQLNALVLGLPWQRVGSQGAISVI